MKKFITAILIVLLCCAPLCACSTDYSSKIDETLNGLYETVYNALEIFFKQYDGEDNSDITNNPNENEKPNAGEGEDNNEGINENEGANGGDSLPENNYETGTQVGEKLPSYFVEIFDENGLSGEFIDPSALGRVTVINFWGTWCSPCVRELPEFSEVASEYKDEVTIVAIHSVQNFAAKAVSHVANNFNDSDIIFAADVDLGEGIAYYDECYEAFGGNGFYPYTIILDKNGVITYAKEGALSKAQLIYRIENALAN